MADSAQCPACGRALDPLRAGQVAIVKGRFSYFCDRACKERFFAGTPTLEGKTLEPPPVKTADPPPVVVIEPPRPEPEPEPEPARVIPPTSPEPSPEPSAAPPPKPSPKPSTSTSAPVETGAGSAADAASEATPTPTPTPTSTSTSSFDRVTTIGFGVVLLICLASLAVRARVVLTSFVLLTSLAALAAAFRAPRSLRELLPLGAVSVVLAPIVLAALYFAAAATGSEDTVATARAAIVAASAAAVALALAERAHRPIARAWNATATALEGVVRQVDEDGERIVPAGAVKPGDRVRVREGEPVLVDGVVQSGDATVRPWTGAPATEARTLGDAIVAGAEVTSGEIVIVTTWASDERGLARALRHRGARVELAFAPLERARRLALPGALAFALLAGAAVGLSANASWVDGVLAFGAVLASVPAQLACMFAALTLAQTAQRALARGIFYRDARAFEIVARLERVALCSGSALLAGTPEVVGVESASGASTDDVLALAAATEMGASHPVAQAIVRAARKHELPALRTVTQHPGLGATAQSATGERVVVGGRMLCMNEAVSIARAEDRIAELESKGRIVVLVASGGRLLGWIAVQDEMRAGARAAVQRLLAAGVEPVMLTGAARATAESLAEALGIEHVRPEVAPDDRGAEVRALATSATGVGTIGHPRYDDAALGAANAAIALGAAGAPPGEWSVAIASDRPEIGAAAVSFARGARDLVRVVSVVGLLPGVTVALALGASLLPTGLAWLGPLAGFVGAGLAFRQALAHAAPDT